MNITNLDLLQNQMESWDIYNTLCKSESMFWKIIKLEFGSIGLCLYNTLEVLLTDIFILISGSTGEGTHITSGDYGKCMHSSAPGYISDEDMMYVWCYVQVIDEGDMLPQRFDEYIYCQAERGEHTTDGFRKLRVIHRPEYYSPREENFAQFINKSVVHGYMSSSKFLATAVSATMYSPVNQSLKTGLGTQGPSQIIESDSLAQDLVSCFLVKTWPKEAESWFTRQTHWPDRKLKSKIRKIGYLLISTGNSNSQECDLEWRSSFSIAEKMLFQSLTKFQTYTFIMLKVLLKENLPSDINTDGKKKLLSTYHIKTLFLWCLEDSNLKWEPGRIVNIIDHLLDVLLEWINRQFFPHYFIKNVNLLDSKQLYGRENSLICFVSAIKNDLSNKIMKSQFFKGQKIKFAFKHMLIIIKMMLLTGRQVQTRMHTAVFDKILFLGQYNFSHSVLIQGLLSIQHDIHPQMHYLYRALYNDPIHDKLLTEVVPGLIDQYRGSIHLAKYCMAARDRQVLPGMLHTAESLLRDTLHLDPCSGYVKLACLFIVTEDFVQAIDSLNEAETKFCIVTSALLRNFQIYWIEVGRLSAAIFYEVFQKLADGQVTSDIVVTWPEYTAVPDLLQFELIHESTQQVIEVPYKCVPGKMVKLDCHIQWPPLSMIKLLKFVCAFNSGQCSTGHMETLVADVITSSLSLFVFFANDIYTVFNMAAWCYVKMKKYKPAIRMMMVSIESNLETDTMQKSAFSHHFLAYVIAQCLL